MAARPPLGVEQALDLVLALPAHRSSNEKHAAFGHLLVQEYFVALREQVKDDEKALGYLTNILAAIASAVRAFSVQRDMFDTAWGSLAAQRSYEIDRANHMDRYSPFKEKGVWGKVIGFAFGSGSVGLILLEALEAYLTNLPVSVILGAFSGGVIGLLVLELMIDIWRSKLLKKAEKRFPEELQARWRSECIPRYRTILRQFLLSAIRIREEWYPELPSWKAGRVFAAAGARRVQLGEQVPSDQEPQSMEAILKEIDTVVDRHLVLA